MKTGFCAERKPVFYMLIPGMKRILVCAKTKVTVPPDAVA